MKKSHMLQLSLAVINTITEQLDLIKDQYEEEEWETICTNILQSVTKGESPFKSSPE